MIGRPSISPCCLYEITHINIHFGVSFGSSAYSLYQYFPLFYNIYHSHMQCTGGIYEISPFGQKRPAPSHRGRRKTGYKCSQLTVIWCSLVCSGDQSFPLQYRPSWHQMQTTSVTTSVKYNIINRRSWSMYITCQIYRPNQYDLVDLKQRSTITFIFIFQANLKWSRSPGQRRHIHRGFIL